MKKQFLILLALACMTFAGGCKDDDPEPAGSVYLYSTAATVDAAAGTRSVTIFTTASWQAAGGDWITVEPLSGGEKGIYPVHLTYGANDTGQPRTASVVFTSGTYSETFTLTQQAQ